MTVFALLTVAASALALIVAYLRRPQARRRLRLGSARFLADFSPAPRSRLAAAPLFVSRLFLIRMGFLAVIAAALMFTVNTAPPGVMSRLGLRIIVDTTASMGVSGTTEGTTRAQEARTLVDTLVRTKQAQAQAEHFPLCTRIFAVDRETRAVPASGEDLLAPRRQGGDPRMLTTAALGDDASCPPTYAIVVTDRRKPAIPAPGDGRSVLWWQVGRPLPNAAIEAVSVDADPLLTGPATVRFNVHRYGPAAARAAAVTGPGGIALATRDCSPTSSALCFEAKASGRYTIALPGSDAFPDDDRAVVDVPQIKALAVDWRLTETPPPAALNVDTGPGAILVAHVEDRPDISSRRAVLVSGKWRGAGAAKLGFFNPDDPLLANVNVDLIEQAAPSPLPVPEGFERAAAIDGGDIVAHRAGPRAALIPPPLTAPDAAAPLRNASLLLLANALRYVSDGSAPHAAVAFVDADGHELPDLRFESDTAEDGDRTDLSAAITPRATAAVHDHHVPGEPLWPWIIVAALAILAIERALALPWRAAA